MSSSDHEPLQLSARTWFLWAKTGGGEQRHLWGSLPVHLADTAETARHIWREWLPNATKRFICGETDLKADEAEALIAWLASMHDIGKATPSFQSKVIDLAEKAREAGLPIPVRCNNLPHAYLGETIVHNWLVDKGWDNKNAKGIASVIGGHHGSNPSNDDLKRIEYFDQLEPRRTLGATIWKGVQSDLLFWALVSSGAEQYEKKLKNMRLPRYVQVQLTGIVIMADWIASNTDLFPLMGAYASWSECAQRAEDAWATLGLPERLDLVPSFDDIASLLSLRFPGMPANAELRPIQSEATAAAKELDKPGLIIIEAPMGEGKTEASLLSAELLAERFACGGMAYLLPTQATSNAMFARIHDWLSSLLGGQPGTVRQDIHLLHGKAELNEEFASLPRWPVGWMGDDGSEEETVIAHQWFSGRKRGLLAPFVVGTVDQLLMAALKAKHAHLRHLGLSGKVVVIDEVHAYDAYMSVYLDRVLEFLGSYHVPTIILSATLPPSRRKQLIQAYCGHSKRGSFRKFDIPEVPRLGEGSPAYPLITISTANDKVAPEYRVVKGSARNTNVLLEYLPEDEELLVSTLKELLEDGGCACVLRDTVARAQSTYQLLKSRLDVEVRLVHARFVALDRVANDERLVRELGASGDERPKSLVVVATQVVEQSLDLDFDLLITDVAPVDLLLQRMGRLHRHPRGEEEQERPPRLRSPRCIITGVDDWNKELPGFSEGIGMVYQPAILWRTIVALRGLCEEYEYVQLPKDIAPLVERVYECFDIIGGEAFEDACRTLNREIHDKEASAKAYLLGSLGGARKPSLDGWMNGPLSLDGEIRGKAVVRDTEETLEVVVVRQTDRGYEVLPWIAERLGVDANLGTGQEEPTIKTARAAALCTVSLPLQMSMPSVIDEVIQTLEQSGTFDGWQRSHWLAGVLPLVLNARGEAMVRCKDREFHLKYSREVGLEVRTERRKR